MQIFRDRSVIREEEEKEETPDSGGASCQQSIKRPRQDEPGEGTRKRLHVNLLRRLQSRKYGTCAMVDDYESEGDSSYKAILAMAYLGSSELFYDDLTSELLDPELVHAARAEEICFICGFPLWDEATIEQCWAMAGKASILDQIGSYAPR